MVKNGLKILASIIMMTTVVTMTVQAATDGNLILQMFQTARRRNICILWFWISYDCY